MLNQKSIIPYLFICLFILITLDGYGQVYSNKVVGEKNAEEIDSLKKSEWPYVLPIWGKEATALGFDLPYSAGLGINFLTQESSITIDNLQVGINNSELFNLDDIVRFNDATSRSTGINFRPDVWVFPFLNVYGIFAQSKTETEVDFGIWVPNGESSVSVLDYSTTAEFDATSFGFGFTPTIGVGGGWMALDMNFTWTDIPELSQPAQSFIFGPRIGKSFKLKNPQSNIVVWVGGFRLNLKSDTDGAISLEEVLPEDGEFGNRIDNGIVAIEEAQMQLDEWYDGLSPVQQTINAPKYTAANLVLAKTNSLLEGMSDAANNIGTASIRYSLDKRPTNMWNFIAGAQYQINKSWMVRAEAGFLGSRNQVIAGLQYRFGL